MQISQCVLQRAGDSAISKFPAFQKAKYPNISKIFCCLCFRNPNILSKYFKYLLLQTEGSTEAAVREAIQPSGPDASCLARFYWGGRCSDLLISFLMDMSRTWFDIDFLFDKDVVGLIWYWFLAEEDVGADLVLTSLWRRYILYWGWFEIDF